MAGPEHDSAKVALVTGAGSGIGRAASLALAADGWSLALAGRDPARLEPVAAEVRAAGRDAVAVACDVGQEAAVQRLFAEVERVYGHLDLLVNNAGVASPPVPLDELSLADWNAVITTNLTGAFLCTRAAFALMKRQQPPGGRIINNGSLSAHVPRPHSAAYTASKHAITGLTRSSALDGRRHRIACGQIDVGNAATEMAAAMRDGVEQADGSVRPEPVMDPDEVARAVVYMASLPLDANVLFLTVMATGMPFVGRG
jgi:NAD(P)-dependent dehydrogenase (short-subunit alcohol dehydrogenase family)